jgi:hypothetical protein
MRKHYEQLTVEERAAIMMMQANIRGATPRFC